MKYQKKPVVVEATQWFKNGDHPQDYANERQGLENGEMRTWTGTEVKALGWEGEVVRYYRKPEKDGQQICPHCGKTLHEHGWIDGTDKGALDYKVCPGDFVVTGTEGEYYTVKPDMFPTIYEVETRRIQDLNDIVLSLEGKSLMAALTILTTTSRTDKTPYQVLEEIEALMLKMYPEEKPGSLAKSEILEKNEKRMNKFLYTAINLHTSAKPGEETFGLPWRRVVSAIEFSLDHPLTERHKIRLSRDLAASVEKSRIQGVEFDLVFPQGERWMVTERSPASNDRSESAAENMADFKKAMEKFNNTPFVLQPAAPEAIVSSEYVKALERTVEQGYLLFKEVDSIVNNFPDAFDIIKLRAAHKATDEQIKKDLFLILDVISPEPSEQRQQAPASNDQPKEVKSSTNLEKLAHAGYLLFEDIGKILNPNTVLYLNHVISMLNTAYKAMQTRLSDPGVESLPTTAKYDGVRLIAKEREEQVFKHKRTVERDLDQNRYSELPMAAAALLIGTYNELANSVYDENEDRELTGFRYGEMPASWDEDICRKMAKKGRIDRLVTAGALIAAEIDRVKAVTFIPHPGDEGIYIKDDLRFDPKNDNAQPPEDLHWAIKIRRLLLIPETPSVEHAPSVNPAIAEGIGSHNAILRDITALLELTYTKDGVLKGPSSAQYELLVTVNRMFDMYIHHPQNKQPSKLA
jgi:hypothetical protein